MYAFASVCVEVRSAYFSVELLQLRPRSQIFTGKTPFRRNRTNHLALALEIVRRARPERPSAGECGGCYVLPDTLWTLMKQCWLKDSSARPSAHQVFSHVRGIQWNPAISRGSSGAPTPTRFTPTLTVQTAHIRAPLLTRTRSPAVSHPCSRPASPWNRPTSPAIVPSHPCSSPISRPSSPAMQLQRPSSPTIRRETRLRRPLAPVPIRSYASFQAAADPIVRPSSMPTGLRFPVAEDWL